MTVVACVWVIVAANWPTGSTASERPPDSPIRLKIASENDNYFLGESVFLRIAEINDSDGSIGLPFKPNVMSGYVSLWVSYEGQQFERYSNSAWGRLEGPGIAIKPRSSFESDAWIFWNHKPQILRKGDVRIKTDYAFPKAGTYRIKAVLSVPEVDSPQPPRKIESEPIQISIKEPTGDDLNVWNRIKDDGDIAYFIQQADTPTFGDEKARKLMKNIETIVQEHPNGHLTSRIKASLEKFQVDEVRRRERLEKAKVKSTN